MANSMPQSNTGFLLADITRRMRGEFQRRLEGTNLTLAQAKALMYLSRQEGLQQKALADMLEIQPMTMAKLLDQLQQSGLIERRRDPNDRRAHHVYLTAEAAPVLTRIEEVTTGLRADMLQDLSDREKDQFIQALTLIRDRLMTL